MLELCGSCLVGGSGSCRQLPPLDVTQSDLPSHTDKIWSQMCQDVIPWTITWPWHFQAVFSGLRETQISPKSEALTGGGRRSTRESIQNKNVAFLQPKFCWFYRWFWSSTWVWSDLQSSNFSPASLYRNYFSSPCGFILKHEIETWVIFF